MTQTTARAAEFAARIAAGTLKPYTCGDEACHQREANGDRCPWCWGAFPVAVSPRYPAEIGAWLDARKAYQDVVDAAPGTFPMGTVSARRTAVEVAYQEIRRRVMQEHPRDREQSQG